MQKTATYKRRQEEGLLTLHGSVDIFEAAMLLSVVKRASNDLKATTVCVDFTGVERLDVSAIQLLLALRRDVEGAGRQFLLRGNASLSAKTLTPLGVSLEP